MLKHRINAADGITASRVVFAALILFCSAFSAEFYVLYVLGACTDVMDGWLARKRNLSSSFGAKLDTTDYLVVLEESPFFIRSETVDP